MQKRIFFIFFYFTTNELVGGGFFLSTGLPCLVNLVNLVYLVNYMVRNRNKWGQYFANFHSVEIAIHWPPKRLS